MVNSIGRVYIITVYKMESINATTKSSITKSRNRVSPNLRQ